MSLVLNVEPVEPEPTLFVPGFVYTKDLIANQAKVEADIARALKKGKHRALPWKVLTLVFGTTTVATSIALAFAVPNIRILPVFLWHSAPGMIGTALTEDSLPLELKTADIKAALWRYVEARESYNYIQYRDNYYLVTGMSDKTVSDNYSNWYNGHDSYVTFYGNRAAVHVRWVDFWKYAPATKDHPGRITILYNKQIEWLDGSPPGQEELWSATFEFITGYSNNMDIRQVLTSNPLRILVRDYPGAVRPPGPAVAGMRP